MKNGTPISIFRNIKNQNINSYPTDEKWNTISISRNIKNKNQANHYNQRNPESDKIRISGNY